ncbi:SDR family oxidoreductase [Aeromicrobium sp. SMF47]|uniref:SDR family oxidoreductase n=1 Tax=Aeromicrobium yanjiei TaxID=2662028 RepID=UPI00129EC16A|nr:SDR family oxidoreductase [Aeromicrobium yanjiei]MRJ76569.1 SDR family oxidoreductase [Aeromicrobium yanjiei]
MTAQSTRTEHDARRPGPDPSRDGQELDGQTVLVIGGSGGIGFATAQLARACGAETIITGRDGGRLAAAAAELDALATAAFDATDGEALDRFLGALPQPVDHVLITAGGPYYAPVDEFDFDRAGRDIEEHLWLPIRVGQHARRMMRPGGSLLFVGGTGARRPDRGLALISAMTAAMPALTQVLALELAPIRVNLLACGFVDTALSASLLGSHLDERREHLRATLPIRRVVGPEDVARLAVHLMSNTALTGATYDVDGGQQVVPG